MSPVLTHRSIHHFGPDPAYVGGMGSVLRVLEENRLGGDCVTVHPTWRPNSRLASMLLTVWAARRLVGLGASEIVHVHLAEDGAFLREGALVLLARALRRVTVITLHGANFLPFADRHPRLTAAVLRRADLITCLDSDVLRRVGELAPMVEATLMPNPVVVDNTSPKADETEEIVLFAGEIGLRKGADVLWRAWQLVSASRPSARCIMVGPAGDFEVPAADRLDVRAAIDPRELKSLMRDARVVALPSRAEGMPMILTEAMGAGRAFVSTPVGGIPDLARAGGILVAVGDEAALAERLIELLADRALARRVGERAREACSATRSVAVIDARLGELYAAAAARS